MSFDQTNPPISRAHQLYNQLFGQLPQIHFDPNWLDNGQVLDVPTNEPVVTTRPDTGQRMMFVPTLKFGMILLYDLWGRRGEGSPVSAVFPEGFDAIDLPYASLARSEEDVASAFKTNATIVDGPALAPIFDRLMEDVSGRKGSLVRFS